MSEKDIEQQSTLAAFFRPCLKSILMRFELHETSEEVIKTCSSFKPDFFLEVSNWFHNANLHFTRCDTWFQKLGVLNVAQVDKFVKYN